MRQLIVVLIAFVYSFSAFAQKPGHVWPAGEAGKDYNVVDAKKQRQGVWIRVYGSNPKALLYKGQFKNNVPVGDWEWYYATGEVMTQMKHINGEEQTYNVNLYESGAKMSEGEFQIKIIDGEKKRCREGLWKMYAESGTVLAEEVYKDSLLNGACKYYYPSGKILSMHGYVGGIQNGPFVDYYENGKKEREGTYLAGDFDGDYKSWNENGTPESEGKFVKGQKNGTWYFYKTSGVLEVSILYKNGVETKRKYNEGTFKEFYDSQIPKSEYTYENGMKNGPFVEWYDQGEFAQVPGTKEDVEMGIMYREKLQGTQVKMEGDYVNDKLEGEVVYYNEKGQVVKVEVYDDGVLKETRQGAK